MDININLKSNDVIHWFNAIRNLPDNERTRALDAFWAGQLDSKCWLVNKLNEYVDIESNVYIFGGWIGVLASILFQNAKFKIDRVRSIDIDPWCEQIANTVCQPYHQDDWRFLSITNSMESYAYDWDFYPNIVINTSTEHVDQQIYDIWYQKIPSDSLIVIQGNNFFDCNEHIRCSRSLVDFKRMNHAHKTIYEGELPHDLYTRYMCIFKK